MNEQIASGTADYSVYRAENFQLTYDEAISGLRYVETSLRFSPSGAGPSVHLVMVDGELFVLNEGAPPDLKPIPKEAAILQVKEP